jgi:hypothetical protein
MSMIAFGRRSIADATRSFHEYQGLTWHKSEWMKTGEDPGLSPTGFLFEQHPDTVVRAHCHGQNQFQVFVEGTGQIGGHEVGALTVHYAGAYTGYGPILAGPEGLKYMTLRPVFESGAIFMDDSRGRLPKGPKRGATVGPIAVPDTASLNALTHVDEEELVKAGPDGLAVTMTLIPSGQAAEQREGGAAAGRFLFVAAGAVRLDGARLEPWETAYVTEDEDLVPLIAEDGGAAILSLFVPPLNPRYAALNGGPERDAVST